MSFLLLATGLALGQTNAPATGPDDSNSVANELKALREAIAAQQQQVAQQQQQIAAQQQQISHQQQLLDQLQKQTGTNQSAATDSSSSGRLMDANLRVAAPATVSTYAQEKEQKESPLSFRIGGADFTPGGFVDFENVFRSTNLGSGISSSFGALPFNNTIQGHLTEFRSTAQYSRFNIKTHTKFGENDVTGYLEFDFNGNDAANVFVTSNPHTDRLRLYWVDLKRGRWEFLGGQSWGLLTPNRTGLSPNPADLALTYGEDANVHVGVNYTRAGTFRVVYHANDNWQIGAAIENPDQFVGAGEVIFPFAFNAALGVQFDAANQTTVPNVAPDFMVKIAYDKNFSGRHFHWEGGGLMSTVKITAVPIGGTTFESHSSVGGGFQTAFNVDVVKGFRVISNGIWGDGIGRYLIGLGPQAVVRPIQTGPTTFDIATSLVHAGAFTAGVEIQPTIWPKSQFGVYYGGEYFQRNAFPDVTSPLVIKPIIGFGGINSPNSANRAIQEVSFDWTQTLWKNPQYGALLFITQNSYVTRSPWFVAAGAPKNAHLFMSYASLRYVLP